MLPLSVYGAVVMAHSDDSEEYSSPNQFFFYRYDKRNVSSNIVLSFMTCIFYTPYLLKEDDNTRLKECCTYN